MGVPAMDKQEGATGPKGPKGPEQTSQKYAPSNLAPPPEEQMRHDAAGVTIAVHESSGIAAAEATGKISGPNEGDAEDTAGSG